MGLLAQIVREPDSIETPHIDWPAFTPLLVLVGGAILLLMITGLARKWLPRWFNATYTALIGVGTLVAVVLLWLRVEDDGAFSTASNAVGIDGFSLFIMGILAASVTLTAMLSYDYLQREKLEGVELYVLLMLSAAGGVIMASANDMIVMFLGLEALSLAAYVLAAMHLRRIQSQEAGLKYFILGAFSSAFFLYGIAFVYGATGSTNLVQMSGFLSENVLVSDGLLLGGFALLLVGLLFKVAAVPFHGWAPDVYQGAPSPVVAYMAAGVKAAGFAALLRIFYLTFGEYRTDWQPVIYVVAILTLLVGALLAIVQTDVKRMLAYSSISHAGFILVGVQAASPDGTSAVLFYLAAYAFMVIGTFGVVTIVGRTGDKRHSVADYRGLASSRPILAFAFTILLLAQAGVPFTTGFIAKFYVIGAAVEARSYWLAIIAMVAAVIAAYLYLRIVVSMYLHPAPEDEPAVRVPFAAGVALAITLAFTVVFGIFPNPLLELSRDAIPVLVNAGG
jgi:NADH-quinone oxidoreductase subunit N